MIPNKSHINFAAATLLGVAAFGPAFGEDKPNFSGAWELVTIERYGQTVAAGRNFKETFIWTHHEPKIIIKMILWDSSIGSRTSEITYTTDGKPGNIGFLRESDGTKSPINGSAHWEGNRLIYEQEFPTRLQGGVPRKIVRTCTLEANGTKLVHKEVFWLPGSEESHEATWTWEKKTGTP
jgi:hypothetical protein